jgi:hypothetical protein
MSAIFTMTRSLGIQLFNLVDEKMAMGWAYGRNLMD